MRQLAVLSRIHDHVHDNSHYIIATHTPILMTYPDAILYQTSPEGLKEIAYEETENF